jgi:hypothetical protein
MMLKDVRFTLHVSAVDASGKEIVIVTNVDTQMGTTAFHAYNHMSKTDYSNNRFVNTTVDSCYDVNELYVGDASKENNFETVAEAITKLIEIIGEAGTLPVDVRVKLADGVHYLKETVTVSSESFDPAANYRFSIKGGSAEDVKVTSNVAIDSSMFTPVSGTGYYSYQFAKDAEGNYPKFRYLYVDGEIATLAHEGILHFNDGEQYKMPFEKGYDASMGLDILYKVNEKGDTVKKSAAELIADINAHPNMAKNKFYMYESIFENCKTADNCYVFNACVRGTLGRICFTSYIASSRSVCCIFSSCTAKTFNCEFYCKCACGECACVSSNFCVPDVAEVNCHVFCTFPDGIVDRNLFSTVNDNLSVCNCYATVYR